MNISEKISIADPLYKNIYINKLEMNLINNLIFNRLKYIKQLGFVYLAFPKAIHTRYEHSLGAMHIATKIFDNIFNKILIDKNIKIKFRQILRLAMLFHDLGHSPFSHSTEIFMPKLRELKLSEKYSDKELCKKATHEDYTLKFILDSNLGKEINKQFSYYGIKNTHIASLISGNNIKKFTHNKLDYYPILHQIITSEIDADRIDYVNRDNFYCKINNIKLNYDYLIKNLIYVKNKSKIFLGINSNSISNFKDFLSARARMFEEVYKHHIPVIFEGILFNCINEENKNFRFTSNIKEYEKLNDINLINNLKKTNNKWVKIFLKYKLYYSLSENINNTIELLKKNNIFFLQLNFKNNKLKCSNNLKFPIFISYKDNKKIKLKTYNEKIQNKDEKYKNKIFIPIENKIKVTSLIKTLNKVNIIKN